MIIHALKFPVYITIISLSVLIGMMYIYYHLKKEKCEDKQIMLYYLMYIMFAIICGKIYTVFAYNKTNFLNAGLSAYGGLIGVIIAAIIFEKILPTNGKIIKYTILSLPLVYGLSKIGCAVAGCCGGIPYDGIFKIKYVDVLNIWQFPIQIIEAITAMLIFIICQLAIKNKNINYIVLLLVSITKFLLDFLRYEHSTISISRNQIFSIILFIITIIIYIYNRERKYERDN